MRTIIIDLDGTLADIGHRRHHVRSKPKRWKEFFEGMHLDPLNVWCRTLMQAMKNEGYRIVIVSGRPDDYRKMIEDWLAHHAVPYDEMHLRRGGDFRPDTVVKREILHAHLDPKDILFVVDDRQGVVEMWREEGLVCLQCDPEND